MYVVGTALNQTANQLTQVIGLALGGVAVAGLHPPGALLLDASTFLLSAVLLTAFVRKGSVGAAGRAATDSRNVFTDVRDGAMVVWRRPVLRAVVLMAWTVAAFAVVPEGLAVAYSNQIGHGDSGIGLAHRGPPRGCLAGQPRARSAGGPGPSDGLDAPARGARRRTADRDGRPALAVGDLLLWGVAGFGSSLHLPAITTFIAHTPTIMRARAFGLADSGLQAVQGLGLVAGGALAQVMAPSSVVALAGVVGLLGVLAVMAGWPQQLRARSVVLPAVPPTVPEQTMPRRRTRAAVS